MFSDVNQYPFLEDIVTSCLAIKNEFDNCLMRNEVIKEILTKDEKSIDYYLDHWVLDNGFHPSQIDEDIRQGFYSGLTVFKKGYPNKMFDIASYFPKTLKTLNKVPGLEYAGFFKMNPKSSLKPHTHNRKHLIFHLLVSELKNGCCEVHCGTESKELYNIGDHLLFDYSQEHWSKNTSESERIHFVIDFKPF